METIYYLVLVPMVYLAFFILLAGSIWRLAAVWRKPAFKPTLQIFPERHPKWFWAIADALLMPTVRKHNPVLWVFLMVFHICVFLLILGHLELFDDIALLQVWTHDVFLGGGFVGLVSAICLIFFLFRRFGGPTKDLSVPEDYFLLILLFLVVIFGAEMDWARRWYDYAEIGTAEYRDYMMSLLTFKPDISSVSSGGHSFMLVVHISFANLFIAFFPFSKLMHSFFTFAVNKVRRG